MNADPINRMLEMARRHNEEIGALNKIISELKAKLAVFEDKENQRLRLRANLKIVKK